MANCSDFSEQLLDYLYDLLDEEDSTRLRFHLQACPHCQAALLEAEGHQRLLAQAARACPVVAPFTAPDLNTPMPAPLAEPAALPRSLPLPSLPSVQGSRFPRWLRYGSVALAASVLLGVVIAQEMYRGGLRDREHQVAAAKQEIIHVDDLHAQAETAFAEQKKAVLQPNPIVQVNMTGSPLFDVDAGALMSFQTNDLAGNPTSNNLDVQVADAASKKVLYETKLVSHAEDNRFAVPPGLHAKELQVTLTARTTPPSPPLVASLRAAAPVYVTHLALNKTSYYVRELLFFRSLTVQQFSLRPIAGAKETLVRFSLLNAQGKEFKRLLGKAGPGGIAAGEFALTDDVSPGTYYLEAAPLGGANMVPQRRRLEILSANTPQVVLNKQQYNPGEVAQGKLYGPNMVPQAEQRVVTDLQAGNGNAAAMNAAPQQTYSDRAGNFRVPLPAHVNSSRARLNIGIPTRTSYDNVVVPINIVPSRVFVDFFPEGGELIDGIPTRVYYRIRSLEGDPVVPDGRLVVESSRKVEFESAPGKAVGVFSLTPSVKESYKVGLASDRTEVVNVNPIARLGIQPQGLALAIPRDVIPGNEPVHAKVTVRGEAKRLLVLVTCRGQIVEQQTLLAKPGETNIELKPLADLAGILRVTVHELKDQTMTPLAERLVYRMPTHRLELAGTGPAIHPGRNHWSARCVDEKKRPVDGYLLAAVVDSQFASDNDLATHFYLDSEISSPAELDNANVLVRDDPASRAALGLFLGTQGWRRFASDVGRVNMARAKKALLEDRRGGPAERTPAETGLVSLQNASLSDLQASEQTRMNEGLKTLHARFLAQLRSLAGEKEQRVGDYNRQVLALAEYERLPGEYLRRSLGLTVMLGFAAAAVLIVLGFVRLVRGRFATPMFAGSIASLAVCVVLVVIGNNLGQEVPDNVLLARNDAAHWTQVPLAEIQPHWPRKVTAMLGPVPQPMLAGRAPQEIIETQVRRGAPEPTFNRSEAAFLREQSADGAFGGAGNPGQLALNQRAGGSARFGNAVEREKTSRTIVPPAPAIMAPGGAGVPQPRAGKDLDVAKAADAKTDKIQRDMAGLSQHFREYAFDFANQQERCDPMLWFPATVLWVPALPVKNGDIQLNFELPEVPAQTSYRLVIQAHTLDGRMGFFDKTVTPAVVPAQAR